MKKLIGTVAVAALLATAAFAEGLSFGSWGRALWVVGNAGTTAGTDDLKMNNNVVTSWLGQSWGGAGPRTALGVSGSSDNMGFNLDLHANGGGLGVGDNALVWAKPIDMIKVTFAAKNDQNVMRSDAAFGLWNFDRIGPVGVFDEEGWIFPSTLNKNVSIVATPIEGLTVGYGFNCWTGDTGWGDPARKTNSGDEVKTGYSGKNANNIAVSKDNNTFADQIGRTSSFAAGYTIANIGTVKLGFQAQGKGYDKNGGIDGKNKDKFEIDAAFELTMLEKVYVALGTRIPLGGTFNKYADIYGDGKYYVANGSATYVNLYSRLSLIDNLKINILAGLKLNSADYKKDDFKASGAFGFRFGVEGEYSLSNGIGFFAEVEYANGIWMASNSSDHNDCLAFGLGATKGFSNGVVGVAFEGATNAYGRNALQNVDDFAWEIPVKLEYWF